MSTISRLLNVLRSSNGADAEFEQYYGSLVSGNRSGAPTAAEARRDYEPVRRHIDRAIYF